MIAHTVDELGDFWAKDVHSFIKPILEADERGEPCPKGTCILASAREKQYVMTANHVTAASALHPEYGALYSFLPEQVEITGPFHCVSSPFDLSMAEIPLEPDRCLRFPDHLAFDVRQGDLCLLLGYPARRRSWEFDRTRLTLKPTPLPYLGRVISTSTTHFSVRLSLKHVHRHGKGLQRLYKLDGISGGGAFVLRGGKPRLAGIVIEYYANRTEIVCTNSTVAWLFARGSQGSAEVS
jgi:hypothetical protein